MNEVIKYSVHKLFHERAAFSSLGLLKELIWRNPDATIEIDMSETEWADPLALLMLGSILGNSSSTRFILNLGLAEKYHRKKEGLPDAFWLMAQVKKREAILEAKRNRIEHLSFLSFLYESNFLHMFESTPLGKRNDDDSPENNFSIHFAGEKFYQKKSLNADNPSGYSCISSAGKPLKECFVDFSYSPYLTTSLCLKPQLLDVSTVQESAELESLIEKMVKEANDYATNDIKPNHITKERLSQKLRILLRESILNSLEHAYVDLTTGERHAGDDSPWFVGLFARFHKPVTNEVKRAIEQKTCSATGCLQKTVLSSGKRFSKCHNIDGRIPGISLHHSPQDYPWVEVNICDAGQGFFAHKDSWSEDVRKHLGSKKVPMVSLADHFFHKPISRFSGKLREQHSRTSVTGLQNIGLFLAIDGDYSRLYSDGVWIATVHPPYATEAGGAASKSYVAQEMYDAPQWYQNCIHEAAYEREMRNTEDTLERLFPLTDKPISISCWHAPGVAVSFCTSLLPANTSPTGEGWYSPDIGEREKILSGFSKETQTKDHKYYAFFEGKKALEGDVVDVPKQFIPEKGILVVRPPRTFTKSHVYQWLQLISGAAVGKNKQKTEASTVLFADLTPYSAEVFSETIKKITENSSFGNRLEKMRVILLTRSWDTVFFMHDDKTGKISPQKIISSLDAKSQRVDNAKSFYTESIGEDKKTGAEQIALFLRDQDSKAFWKGIHWPVYYSGKVLWDEDQLNGGGVVTKKGSTNKLNGYLSFANAITDHKRFRVCQNAILRCLALLDNYNTLASDSLTQTLATHLSIRGRSLSKDKIESEEGRIVGAFEASQKSYNKQREVGHILIASVAVTTNTVTELLAVENDSIEAVVCVFVHPSAQNFGLSLPSNISLRELLKHKGKEIPFVPALLWAPEASTSEENLEPASLKETKFARIKGTPYIASGGSRAIQVNTYKKNSEKDKFFDESYYGRTKEEAYRDFDTLNCLRLQHTHNGETHDLISLNCQRAFMGSSYGASELRSWLKKEFDARDIIKGSTIEKPLILYPAHYSSESIINEVVEREKSLTPDYPYTTIAVTFISGGTQHPLRISPTSEQELEKYFNSENTAKNIVIFDDGVITGKHVSAIKHFLKSHEVAKKKNYHVSTVIIVDRSGVPVYDYALEQFTEKNKRFWRLDVPPVGTQTGCILCDGVKAYSNYAKSIDQRVYYNRIARIARWTDLWRTREIYSEWGLAGLDKHDLPLTPEVRNLRFEFVRDTEGDPHFKTLSLKNSTNLATAFVELTRLTPRKDKALKRARRLIREGLNTHAATILATQYFLFFSSLSRFDRLTLLKTMLEAVLRIGDKDETHDILPLFGYCLAITEEKLLTLFWDQSLIPAMRKQLILALDVQIAISYVDYVLKMKWPQSDPNEPDDYLDFNKYFLKNLKTYKESFAEIIDIIGVRQGECHNSDLRKLLTEATPLNKEGRLQVRELVRVLVNGLLGLLRARSGATFRHPFVAEFGKKLLEAVGEYEKAITNNSTESLQRSLSVFKSLLYDKPTGLHEQFHKGYILNAQTRACVSEKILQLFEKSEGDRAKKTAELGKTFKMTFSITEELLPWAEDYYYFGPEIDVLFKNLFCNIPHASGPSVEPGKIPEADSDKRVLWVTIESKQETLCITLRNAIDPQEEEIKKLKSALYVKYLTDIGGLLKTEREVSGGQVFYKTIISIPSVEVFTHTGATHEV